MTDRERLIELLRFAYGEGRENENVKQVEETMADYLLANGVIVPPCKTRKIKLVDKVYFPLYDDTAPEESEVGTEEVFDVGTNGIYLNCESGLAYFYSYDELGKTFFLTKKEAENELLCIIASG